MKCRTSIGAVALIFSGWLVWNPSIVQAQDRRVEPRGYVVYKVDITDFSQKNDIPIASYALRKDAEKYAAYRRNKEKSWQHWNYTVVKVSDDEKAATPDSDSPPPTRRVPTKALPADDLVNSMVKGSETLQGFGELSFQFNANNEVIMYDTAGTSTGRWQRVGNQVTLYFFDGKVVYAGTIRGDQIGGSAGNGKTTWQWKAQIQR